MNVSERHFRVSDVRLTPWEIFLFLQLHFPIQDLLILQLDHRPAPAYADSLHALDSSRCVHRHRQRLPASYGVSCRVLLLASHVRRIANQTLASVGETSRRTNGIWRGLRLSCVELLRSLFTRYFVAIVLPQAALQLCSNGRGGRRLRSDKANI